MAPNTESKIDQDLQKFLDKNQYSSNGILRYEKIFGATFVSVGGETTTRMFTDKMGLEKDMKVLDIGCGIGGSAFLMARKYDVNVHGVDLSHNMLNIANSYRTIMEPRVKHRTQFHFDDALNMQYPEEFYDYMYSRDAIMHIEDKKTLYKKVLSSLKPGGRILVSEYAVGDKDLSPEFVDYVKQRNYQLLTVKAYGKLLEEVGFVNVEAKDVTSIMIDMMYKELEKFSKMKDEFIKEFSEKDYNDIKEGWEVKIVRCKKGDQVWGLFTAEKPQ